MVILFLSLAPEGSILRVILSLQYNLIYPLIKNHNRVHCFDRVIRVQYTEVEYIAQQSYGGEDLAQLECGGVSTAENNSRDDDACVEVESAADLLDANVFAVNPHLFSSYFDYLLNILVLLEAYLHLFDPFDDIGN